MSMPQALSLQLLIFVPSWHTKPEKMSLPFTIMIRRFPAKNQTKYRASATKLKVSLK